MRSSVIARSAVLVLGVALAVRFAPVLAADFPLNDGGLFGVMSDDLRANSFRLPAQTSYEGIGIPFAYPPVGLYLVAILGSLFNTVQLLRIVPAVESVVAVVGFMLFARAILQSRVATIAAWLAFATVPVAFFWFVMGGGVTRAAGLAACTFALHGLVLFSRSGRPRDALYASIASGLTLMSHPQVAWMLAVSAPFIVLSLRPVREAARLLPLVGLLSLAVASPWLVAVIAQHGIEPFVAALGARGGDAITVGLVSREPFLPLIELAALLGVIALVRPRPWLAAWVIVTLFLDSRSSAAAAIPLAIAAGAGVEAILPAIPQRVRPSLAVGALVFVLVSALVADVALMPVPGDVRELMSWIGGALPADARVLVISGRSTPIDGASEWFPALARRRSVATPQGFEWVADRYSGLVRAHDEVQRCRTASCLEDWSRGTAIEVGYVLLAPRDANDDCCSSLAASLAADPRFALMRTEGVAALYRAAGP